MDWEIYDDAMGKYEYDLVSEADTLLFGRVTYQSFAGSWPYVPDLVHPDAWLNYVKGKHLVRKVNRQGEVSVDLYPYSLSHKLAGQKVTLAIQTREQSLEVVYPQEYRRSFLPHERPNSPSTPPNLPKR